MARPLRIEVPDGTYHVFARGAGGRSLFRDDADRRSFLANAERTRERLGWRCLSYCLLDNHFHLLVQTPRPDLSRGMRQINGVHAQRFNRRHETYGPLFQGRYGAVLVERDEYLLWLFRYIARNPVEAEQCEDPADWRWSSHRRFLGRSAPGSLTVEIAGALELFDGPPDARTRYARFVADEAFDEPEPPVGVIAGGSAFIERHAPSAAPSPEIRRCDWQPLRPSLGQIFRGEETDEGIAVAHRRFGYRMAEIADHLGCHYATVSRRLRRWERRMSQCKT